MGLTARSIGLRNLPSNTVARLSLGGMGPGDVVWQAEAMSGSSPDDLAVTFRSLARRSREAIGDADPEPLGELVAELQRHVDAAAETIGSAPDSDAIAAAIEARPAEAWDEPTLDALRREALDAGATLRRLAAAAEAQQDGV
jgi:hypothetical protein